MWEIRRQECDEGDDRAVLSEPGRGVTLWAVFPDPEHVSLKLDDKEGLSVTVNLDASPEVVSALDAMQYEIYHWAHQVSQEDERCRCRYGRTGTPPSPPS